MSTWTIDQVEHQMATLEASQPLEQVRVIAQLRAYRSDEPWDVRRRWAKLSLTANGRVNSDSVEDHTRQQHQNFALRAWAIEHLGPSEDPEWDPEALAIDTLAALPLDVDQAALLSARRRELPIEQINALRRHKNLTVHLDMLVGRLRAGPIKDRVIAWLGVRDRLP